jgi:hypothetical protein
MWLCPRRTPEFSDRRAESLRSVERPVARRFAATTRSAVASFDALNSWRSRVGQAAELSAHSVAHLGGAARRALVPTTRVCLPRHRPVRMNVHAIKRASPLGIGCRKQGGQPRDESPSPFETSAIRQGRTVFVHLLRRPVRLRTLMWRHAAAVRWNELFGKVLAGVVVCDTGKTVRNPFGL